MCLRSLFRGSALELMTNHVPGPADSRFLRACRGIPVDATPVWFMRQAGRYLPEYRAIRAKVGLLDLIAKPELAAEVTLQPVRLLGVDAAILFSDLLAPVIPMGVSVEYAASEGPVIQNPIRTMGAVASLVPVDPRRDLGHVLETIRIVRTELGPVPLIGFSGAPFTMASYLIEGGGSRNFLVTKRLMYTDPEVWQGLLSRLADLLAEFLVAQVEAGAQALQVFDSWVGVLSPHDYERYVLPYSARVLEAAEATGVPVIHFGTQTASLLRWMKEAGGTVMGVDWRMPLDEARAALGNGMVLQGNLDPAALLAPWSELRSQVDETMRRGGGGMGHIFNLGHGILPQTPVEHVKAIVERVHEYTAERA